MSDQLALLRPAAEWNVRRLTQQQQGVLEWARLHGEIRTREVRRVHGYRCPSAALRVLVGRGLLVRARRGRYVPVMAPMELSHADA